MSGNFQRPSLRPDTFENHENRLNPRGGGLKAAFQSRTTQQSTEPYNNAPHYSQDQLSREHGRGDSANSTRGLKSAYESRTLAKPKVDDYDTNANLKPYPWTTISSVDDKTARHPSGLRGAFITRQQGIKMTMGDDGSESSSNSSVHVNGYETEFDRIRYREISEDSNRDNGYMEDQESLEDEQVAGHHSIHRLSQFSNRQGGSNLRRAFEARTGGTVRRNLRSNQHDALLERHANFIVSKMEQDEALMEDSPDAEELRRTALRDMPQCLTIKRCVKVKLSKSVSQKSKRKPISCWKIFKYHLSMNFKKFKINIRDLAYSFELWYEPLKKIEGNFGTGVASFFKFLRWLFLLNIIIAIIAIGFIVIPKIMHRTATESPSLSFSDLFTGEGYLTDTLMYYGYYTNETVGSSSLPYSMPHAYFFTMLSIFIVSFGVIGFSAAKSYRRSFIETEGGLKNVFASKIFCGWDYNIANRDAADLKTKAIYNELKELISEFTRKRHKETAYQKFLTVSIQFFMNFIVLCLIAGTAYAIWSFLSNVTTDRGTKIIVAPVFINAVMTLMPMFLSFIIQYEDYKNPKVSLYLTLARTFLLGAVTIGVLVTYWLYNESSSVCWETSLAQEFYRMIIFDFFISVVCAAVLDVFLFLFYKYLRKNTSLEFDIAWNTMQIIYNQTLFWVGLVFSPLLPVVVVIKLFLCWYIRLCIVLFLCKPSTKSWRAAQTSTWFLVMTFLSLVFITALVGYIMSYIPTTNGCGPFKNYSYIYEIVTLGVFQLKTNSTVWKVVLFVTKPGVIAIAAIFLAARVYYSRAQANAQKEIVEQCRNMLVWSAKDKEYYYALISQATKGQWQYQSHDKSVNPELYEPNLFVGSDSRDFIGTSMSTQNFFNPNSGTTFPSSSTLSFDMDADRNQYSQYKKYT